MAERIKTAAECRRTYDALAAETTAFALTIPKIEAEIKKRVTAEMGDPLKKLADMKARKVAAHREWEAANERERPAREAKAKADAEAKAKAEDAARAKANADRIKEEIVVLRQRLEEAVA